MDSRFGIKDFFLFLLLVALIVIVVLAMVQYDRQWDKIQTIENKLNDQSRDLRAIQIRWRAAWRSPGRDVPLRRPSS